MERLAASGQLMSYRHGSFWQCMDAQRHILESLWQSGNAPRPFGGEIMKSISYTVTMVM